MTVLVIGNLAADIIIGVDGFPILGNHWSQVVRSQINPGGVAVTAVGCARLGIDCHLIGVGADDLLGKFIVSCLRDEKVALSLFAEVDNTPKIYSLIDKHGNYSILAEPTLGGLRLLDVNWTGVLQSVGLVYLDGYCLNELPEPAIISILNSVSQAGVEVLFDPQQVTGILDSLLLRRMLTHTTILSINNNELESLLDALELTDNLNDLLEIGPKVVLVKRGVDGCEIFSRDGLHRLSANITTTVNSQGAGDSFNAAVLASRMWGFSFFDAARVGIIASSLKVADFNSANGMPYLYQVIDEFNRLEVKDHPIQGLKRR